MPDPGPSGDPDTAARPPARDEPRPAPAPAPADPGVPGDPGDPWGPLRTGTLSAAAGRLWTRIWPRPAAPMPLAVLAGLAAVALLAGSMLLAVPGAQWPVIALAILGVAVRAARVRGDGQGRPRRGDLALGLLAVALAAVGALRTEPGMLALCLLGALGLGAAAALGATGWPTLVLAPLLLLGHGLRGVGWSLRGLARARRLPLRPGMLRGAVLAAGVVWVAGALLASADAAFAGLVDAALPDLRVTDQLAEVMARVFVGGVVAGYALTLAHAAAVGGGAAWTAWRRPARPAAEWLLPVGALVAVLAAFLAVQAAELFEAFPQSLVAGHATPAERARQGFGQLVVVTMIAIALLAWAGRRAAGGSDRHRQALALAGGALLVLVLVLVASAVRRLWLYEEAFGWTVLRLVVLAFELWLGAVLVLVAAAWWLRRTSALPRLVVAAAGAGLLALGLAAPDALVASWNVDRFAHGQRTDLEYLARLSDDAVPAIGRLPEPQRSCVLRDRRVRSAPWYAVNLSRSRAAAVLRTSRPATGEACAGVRPRW